MGSGEQELGHRMLFLLMESFFPRPGNFILLLVMSFISFFHRFLVY
jgi:hypothetical protein